MGKDNNVGKKHLWPELIPQLPSSGNRRKTRLGILLPPLDRSCGGRSHGKCARLQVGKSGFVAWPGHCAVYSQCISPSRSTGKLSGKPDEVPEGNLGMNWHPIQGGVVILLVT